MALGKHGGFFMCFKFNFLFFVWILFQSVPAVAQTNEPDFIGEAYLLNDQGERTPLDKEVAAYTKGISWKANSWNALSLEVAGGKAQTRVAQGHPVKLVVRAMDNNSDPLSIIKIYRLRAKKKKRVTVLSEDNSGTLMKSRTHTENLLSFVGQKYGSSSYLLTINGIEKGEYGIVVSNPNNIDEKRTVLSCFGVD